MDKIFSIEGLLVLGLVILGLVVFYGFLQQKTEKIRARDGDGQPPPDADPDLSPEARAVIEAAEEVIEVAQRRQWGAEELELLRRCVGQIYDVVADLEKASQPAPLPPLRQDPPDPTTTAGNGQGPGQPDPGLGTGNPGAV